MGGSHGSGGFLSRQGQASRCSTVRPARRRDSKYPARKGFKGPAFVRWLPLGAEARVRISVLDGALLRPRGLGQDRRGTQSPPALPCVLWYMFGRLGGVSVLLGSVESVRGRRAKGSLARRTGSVLASLSQGRRAHSTRGEGSRFSPFASPVGSLLERLEGLPGRLEAVLGSLRTLLGRFGVLLGFSDAVLEVC